MSGNQPWRLKTNTSSIFYKAFLLKTQFYCYCKGETVGKQTRHWDMKISEEEKNWWVRPTACGSAELPENKSNLYDNVSINLNFPSYTNVFWEFTDSKVTCDLQVIHVRLYIMWHWKGVPKLLKKPEGYSQMD